MLLSFLRRPYQMFAAARDTTTAENIEVKIPSAGESITSGVLSIWHKKDGERVNRDELLFTLETDKVSQEVTAADSGILHTKVAEGEEVKIGQVVAEIEPVAAGAPAAPAPAPIEEKAPVAEAPKATPPAATPAPSRRHRALAVLLLTVTVILNRWALLLPLLTLFYDCFSRCCLLYR